MARTLDYFFADLHARRGQEASKLKPFQDFVLQAIDIIDTSHESFWQCRNALVDLALSRASLDYIECELLTGISTEHHFPELVLLECDCFSLCLQLLLPRPPSTTVSTSVEHRMLAMVRGSAQLHRFEQPKVDPLDVFDESRKIVPLGVSTLSAGEVVKIRAAADCYKLYVDRPAVMLEMRSAPIFSFQWSYNPMTLAPTSVLFVGPEDMRAELGLLTAMNLGRLELVPYVHSFLAHPNPYIRCSALKALVYLDAVNAIAHLDAAAHDSHPQVQAVAIEAKLQIEMRSKGVTYGTDLAH